MNRNGMVSISISSDTNGDPIVNVTYHAPEDCVIEGPGIGAVPCLTELKFDDGRASFSVGQPEDLGGRVARLRGELTKARKDLRAERRTGHGLRADLVRMTRIVDATADAVMSRQSFLRVPRCTEAHPAGMDAAEAVAQGFDDLHGQVVVLREQVAQLQAAQSALKSGPVVEVDRAAHALMSEQAEQMGDILSRLNFTPAAPSVIAHAANVANEFGELMRERFAPQITGHRIPLLALRAVADMNDNAARAWAELFPEYVRAEDGNTPGTFDPVAALRALRFDWEHKDNLIRELGDELDGPQGARNTLHRLTQLAFGTVFDDPAVREAELSAALLVRPGRAKRDAETVDALVERVAQQWPQHIGKPLAEVFDALRIDASCRTAERDTLSAQLQEVRQRTTEYAQWITDMKALQAELFPHLKDESAPNAMKKGVEDLKEQLESVTHERNAYSSHMDKVRRLTDELFPGHERTSFLYVLRQQVGVLRHEVAVAQAQRDALQQEFDNIRGIAAEFVPAFEGKSVGWIVAQLIKELKGSMKSVSEGLDREENALQDWNFFRDTYFPSEGPALPAVREGVKNLIAERDALKARADATAGALDVDLLKELHDLRRAFDDVLTDVPEQGDLRARLMGYRRRAVKAFVTLQGVAGALGIDTVSARDEDAYAAHCDDLLTRLSGGIFGALDMVRAHRDDLLKDIAEAHIFMDQAGAPSWENGALLSLKARVERVTTQRDEFAASLGQCAKEREELRNAPAFEIVSAPPAALAERAMWEALTGAHVPVKHETGRPLMLTERVQWLCKHDAATAEELEGALKTLKDVSSVLTAQAIFKTDMHGEVCMSRRIRTAADILRAAATLYDNRLGWSDGRSPYAPPYFWDELGRALGRDPKGFCGVTGPEERDALQLQAFSDARSAPARRPDDLGRILSLIRGERERMMAKNYDALRPHEDGEFARAAAAYAIGHRQVRVNTVVASKQASFYGGALWPWGFKRPKIDDTSTWGRFEQVVKGAALLTAEAQRLARIIGALPSQEGQEGAAEVTDSGVPRRSPGSQEGA